VVAEGVNAEEQRVWLAQTAATIFKASCSHRRVGRHDHAWLLRQGRAPREAGDIA